MRWKPRQERGAQAGQPQAGTQGAQPPSEAQRPGPEPRSQSQGGIHGRGLHPGGHSRRAGHGQVPLRLGTQATATGQGQGAAGRQEAPRARGGRGQEAQTPSGKAPVGSQQSRPPHTPGPGSQGRPQRGAASPGSTRSGMPPSGSPPGEGPGGAAGGPESPPGVGASGQGRARGPQPRPASPGHGACNGAGRAPEGPPQPPFPGTPPRSGPRAPQGAGRYPGAPAHTGSGAGGRSDPSPSPGGPAGSIGPEEGAEAGQDQVPRALRTLGRGPPRSRGPQRQRHRGAGRPEARLPRRRGSGGRGRAAMSRPRSLGRFAVGVILWLVASPSLGPGQGEALPEPPDPARVQAGQQIAGPNRGLGARGALPNLSDEFRALPARDEGPRMSFTATDPGEWEGADLCDPKGQQARACANFGAGTPGQVACGGGNLNPGGGRNPLAGPLYCLRRPDGQPKPTSTSRESEGGSVPRRGPSPGALQPGPLLRPERGRPAGSERVHPGWPGWFRPPGDPGSLRTSQGARSRWSTPRESDGVRPGWPGRLRPPGDPGMHQLRTGDYNDCWGLQRVHPGGPGRPRPPGDPGSHRGAQGRASSPRAPDGVRPGRPGRLWPPGDPGLHRLLACGCNDYWWPQRVRPGWPGRPRPPGDPGLHRATLQRELSTRQAPDAVRPGRPGRLWPPGDPGQHRLLACGCNDYWWSQRVRPGWPGRPRPPGDPGSHRGAQGQAGSPRAPDRVRPGRPGRLWPPGDPGLHRLLACGHDDHWCSQRVRPGWPGRPRPPGDPGQHRAAPDVQETPPSAAGGSGQPGGRKRARPAPYAPDGRPSRRETGLTDATGRGELVPLRIHGEGRGRSSPCRSRPAVARKKVSPTEGRIGAELAPGEARITPRTPCLVAGARYLFRCTVLGPTREYPPGGSAPGSESVGEAPERCHPASVCVSRGVLHASQAVGSTRPRPRGGLPRPPVCGAVPCARIRRELRDYPGNLASARPFSGSQRPPPDSLPGARLRSGPWATHGPAPARGLLNARRKERTSLALPSRSSGQSVAPSGPGRWRASSSTTSAPTGQAPAPRRPSTSGPLACAPPMTRMSQPCKPGCASACPPRRPNGRRRAATPRTTVRDPPGAPVERSQSPAECSPRTPTGNSGPGTRAGPVEDGARDGEERLGTPAARSTGGTTTGAATARGAPARHPPTHGTKGTTKGCEVRKRREPPPTHGGPTPTTSSVSSPRSSSRRREAAGLSRTQTSVEPRLTQGSRNREGRPGGRQSGWWGGPTRTCATGTGGVGHFPVATPTSPAGPSARFAKRQSRRQSGSSHWTPGRERAGAGPRSSPTTEEPAECATPPSHPWTESRGSTIPSATPPCRTTPPSRATYRDTQRSPSCSGPRPCSTRRARPGCLAAGRQPQSSGTRPSRSPLGNSSKCPTSPRTWWRPSGRWTTPSSAESSWGTAGVPGGTPIPPHSSTCGGLAGRRPARSGSPSFQPGRTISSPTTASGLTGAPSPASGSPSRGSRPAPRGPSTGSACPLSWTSGPRTGSRGPTGWQRTDRPSSPEEHRPDEKGWARARTQGEARLASPTARGATRCRLGRLSRECTGTAPTRRTPQEDRSGLRHREPQERSGSPSTRPRAGTRPSSTGSRTTEDTRSRGSWTWTGSRSCTRSPEASSRKGTPRAPCTRSRGRRSPSATVELGTTSCVSTARSPKVEGKNPWVPPWRTTSGRRSPSGRGRVPARSITRPSATTCGTPWAPSWSLPRMTTQASPLGTRPGQTRWAMCTRRSLGSTGWRRTTATSRTCSSPSWTWTRSSTPAGGRARGEPPLGSYGGRAPSGALCTSSSTRARATDTGSTDPPRPWGASSTPGRPGLPARAAPCGSPSGRAPTRDQCPGGSTSPHLRPARPTVAPGETPRMRAVPQLGRGRLAPRTTHPPSQGGTAGPTVRQTRRRRSARLTGGAGPNTPTTSTTGTPRPSPSSVASPSPSPTPTCARSSTSSPPWENLSSTGSWPPAQRRRGQGRIETF